MLDRGCRAGARNRHHRVEEFAARRRIARAARRVEPTAIGEAEIAVEAEEIRRAYGAVGSCDVLRFVDHVRNGKAGSAAKTFMLSNESPG